VDSTQTRAYVYATARAAISPRPQAPRAARPAVSDSGLVAGRINGEITLWENGNPRGLGAKGNVSGIGENGVLVGAVEDGTTSQFGGANTRAFMWSNGVFTDLGAPSGVTTAVGINRRGQIAVIANGKLFMHENGALRDLGVTVTTAVGFNDRSEIVGMTSFGHGPEPYIYDGALHQIPNAYTYAGAVGLNNMGQVLGSGEGVYGFLMESGQVVASTRCSAHRGATASPPPSMIAAGSRDTAEARATSTLPDDPEGECRTRGVGQWQPADALRAEIASAADVRARTAP
jgi:hypothetical protein